MRALSLLTGKGVIPEKKPFHVVSFSGGEGQHRNAPVND